MAVPQLSVDVAIAGAGVAGSVAALIAARAGRSVALIHARPRRRNRGETVPPEFRPLLEELGLWPEFLRSGPRECWSNQSCWGSAQPRERHYICHPYGCAWHVSLPAFEAELRATAAQHRVRLIDGHVTRAENRTEHVALYVETSDRAMHVDAAVVIDATGRSARVARGLGATRLNIDQTTSFATTCEPTGNAGATDTLVEATDIGWWYSAPATDGLSVMLVTDTEVVDLAVNELGKQWVALLQRAPNTSARARAAANPALAVAAAGPSRLDPVAGPNWLAVGDAAATYDPLSSSGILHAASSAAAGAQAADALRTQDFSAITDYPHREMELFDEHLRQRSDRYRTEQRWPASAFWTRRDIPATSRQ
ncbi:tryptophan 7-halogenase [Nocardia sp. NBC_01009]|uniref:tryptophan 7-halogenase n=1 Tax=Nocardia sp. NBC_01009 TaxID=2975996 RepID=UPI00386D292A|nr:tryptophan 7-halogenase [Nocardia sp. NBC_01009]